MGNADVDDTVPAAVQEWFSRRRSKAKAALEGCRWWQEARVAEGYEVDKQFPVGPGFDSWRRKHYVVGAVSQFVMEHARTVDHSHYVWAVHLDEYSDNTMGMAQGGAIAAIFDFTLAVQGARLREKQTTVTSSLDVKYIRPAKPIPGVMRVDVRVSRDEGREVELHGELSNGAGLVLASSSSTIKVPSRSPRPQKSRL